MGKAEGPPTKAEYEESDDCTVARRATALPIGRHFRFNSVLTSHKDVWIISSGSLNPMKLPCSAGLCNQDRSARFTGHVYQFTSSVSLALKRTNRIWFSSSETKKNIPILISFFIVLKYVQIIPNAVLPILMNIWWISLDMRNYLWVETKQCVDI
jgi:hypothetical protein